MNEEWITGKNRKLGYDVVTGLHISDNIIRVGRLSIS